MKKILNLIIELCKWPAAVYMLLSLPAYFMSLKYFNFLAPKYFFFFGGAMLFVFSFTVSEKSVRTSMQTAAHELTHAFLALLTFHKITHIRLNPDDSGGSVGFEGESNWLIVIAPYFFPLFAFAFMMIFSFLIDSNSLGLLLNATLGYLTAYHIDTVTSQIHEKQTDLSKVGHPFCWMFLPGANFAVIGSILAFNSKGWTDFFLYHRLIWHLNMENLAALLNLF